MHRILIIFLLLLIARKAIALNSPSGFSTNATVLASTSGVIGSVSMGNIANKINVFVSSFAATAAVGSTVILSSRTTTAGKTFYLQYIDAWGYVTSLSTSTNINMGSLAIFNPKGASIASMTFTGGQVSTPRWVMEFAEPVPISSLQTIASSVTANTATSVAWVTNFFGYEK